MRTLLATALLPLLVLLGGHAGTFRPLHFGDIQSRTLIDVGKQFVLGGQQRGAFRVEARNSGPVPVSVAERPATGRVQERGLLEPGQRVQLTFAAGSAALVRNLGERQAILEVKITGAASGLGMTYEALRK